MPRSCNPCTSKPPETRSVYTFSPRQAHLIRRLAYIGSLIGGGIQIGIYDALSNSDQPHAPEIDKATGNDTDLSWLEIGVNGGLGTLNGTAVGYFLGMHACAFWNRVDKYRHPHDYKLLDDQSVDLQPISNHYTVNNV